MSMGVILSLGHLGDLLVAAGHWVLTQGEVSNLREGSALALSCTQAVQGVGLGGTPGDPCEALPPFDPRI